MQGRKLQIADLTMIKDIRKAIQFLNSALDEKARPILGLGRSITQEMSWYLEENSKLSKTIGRIQ